MWSPGIVHGLLQTEDYARALISVQPTVTAEIARAGWQTGLNGSAA